MGAGVAGGRARKTAARLYRPPLTAKETPVDADMSRSVSVVVPAFNAETTLAAALRSVLLSALCLATTLQACLPCRRSQVIHKY